MIVDIEKYRRFTLNQRLCAPTQPRPIFFYQLMKYSLKAKKTLENTDEKSVLQSVPTIDFVKLLI